MTLADIRKRLEAGHSCLDKAGVPSDGGNSDIGLEARIFLLATERDTLRDQLAAANKEIADSLTRWTDTRKAILEPANCGVAGHFRFQENGGHCTMCQRLTAERQAAQGLVEAFNYWLDSECRTNIADKQTKDDKAREGGA